MKRRVAMIGSGWIAPMHARAWQANGVDVVAIVSKDPAQARQLGASLGSAPLVGESVEALAAVDFDFLDLLVPPMDAAALVAALAPRGRPILCEKPLGLSVAECETMLATARAHGVPLMVMHNQLFFLPHRRAREIIESGEIGEPKLLRMHLVGFHSAVGTWKQALVGQGGMIWDDGMHRIYTAQFLLGPVETVAGVQRDLFAAEGEGISGSVSLGFRDRRMGVWDFSYRLGGGEFYDDSLTVIGTKGVVHVNGCYGRPQPLPGLSVRVGDAWRIEASDDAWADTFGRLVAHFLECVERGEDSPLIGGHAALQAVRVAEAIATSFATGREIKV